MRRAAGEAGDLFLKPNPAYLVGQFDAGQTREYLGQALEATRGCVVEVILKDTHTCEHHPERFTEWTQVAREAGRGVARPTAGSFRA